MQDFLEYRGTGLLVCLDSCALQHADPPLGLLRPRGKRPSSRYTADKRNEIASPHWLPSSRGSHPTMVTAALCITANLDRRCPLWVKSRHQRISTRCPLYPQKQTSLGEPGMSALCQKQTFVAYWPLRDN
jgi:hypothetical protein